MTHFVLVHGAWQGAWVWQSVSAALVMHGHEVSTFDLPGGGEDRTPLDEVTLDRYAERIAAAVLDAGNPVTLVGDSMGGLACAAAAELIPGHLSRLIYLSAFAPCNGDTLRPSGPVSWTPGTACAENDGRDIAEYSARVPCRLFHA
jgi:pimeloyl-ACP methyl ester carboxylesterase